MLVRIGYVYILTELNKSMDGSTTQFEAVETTPEYRFRVESECHNRNTPGWGDMGAVVYIRSWAAAPFGGDCCPLCGYDRVEERTIYNPEDDRTTWTCQACGHDSNAHDAEMARQRRDDELYDLLRAAFKTLAAEQGWRDDEHNPVLMFNVLGDHGVDVLADTEFTHQDVYALDDDHGY